MSITYTMNSIGVTIDVGQLAFNKIKLILPEDYPLDPESMTESPLTKDLINELKSLDTDITTLMDSIPLLTCPITIAPTIPLIKRYLPSVIDRVSSLGLELPGLDFITQLPTLIETAEILLDTTKTSLSLSGVLSPLSTILFPQI